MCHATRRPALRPYTFLMPSATVLLCCVVSAAPSLYMMDEALERLVKEHRGITMEVAALAPDVYTRGERMEIARAKRLACMDAIVAFKEGACLCNASSHAKCTSPEECDAVEDAYKVILRENYEQAVRDFTEAAKEFAGLTDANRIQILLDRRREICEELEVDPDLYLVDRTNLEGMIGRLEERIVRYRESHTRIEETRAKMGEEGIDTIRQEAEEARFKAWSTTAADAVGLIFVGGHEHIFKGLSEEQSKAAGSAVRTAVEELQKLWLRRKDPSSLAASAEAFAGVQKVLGKSVVVLISDPQCRLLAEDTVKFFTAAYELAKGGFKGASQENPVDQMKTMTESLISAAAAMSPVAKAGKIGANAVTSIYLSYQLNDDIEEMKWAASFTEKAERDVKAQIELQEARLALHQHVLEQKKKRP